ncbi:MAG: hypothetical protein ABJQ39_13935 [Winogradskyella arenosi]
MVTLGSPIAHLPTPFGPSMPRIYYEGILRKGLQMNLGGPYDYAVHTPPM